MANIWSTWSSCRSRTNRPACCSGRTCCSTRWLRYIANCHHPVSQVRTAVRQAVGVGWLSNALSQPPSDNRRLTKSPPGKSVWVGRAQVTGFRVRGFVVNIFSSWAVAVANQTFRVICCYLYYGLSCRLCALNCRCCEMKCGCGLWAACVRVVNWGMYSTKFKYGRGPPAFQNQRPIACNTAQRTAASPICTFCDQQKLEAQAQCKAAVEAQADRVADLTYEPAPSIDIYNTSGW